ncbi:alkaline shock response membrane anchor protein AmaP [Amycolatopsis suaedae]|uniref:Alkaline shock response membrane anchor protein AmaP n=1 Tax=Amycolatopsis suaedae TaxID=2510978 RepID=A0A4Q7JBX2_9PSEU|nr:alkaline shock response membrane anchor protein AmaP [Amycolatopsis suaedae]RZQ64608.1 alkaline shock response membrane anchor protein AmaP [Amycolatopsis suaedae]
MSGLNRPARLNRALLSLFGLILLAAGGFAAATYFGVLTVVNPASPLVPGTARPPGWVLYLTAAVAIVAGLLLLRWSLAQLAGKPKTRTWHIENDPAKGRTELAASTAVEPFVAEVSAYPGVHTAQATLTGDRDAPTLVLVITTTQDGDLATIRDHLTTEGLPRLRGALDLDTLPVRTEFRFTTRPEARAV